MDWFTAVNAGFTAENVFKMVRKAGALVERPYFYTTEGFINPGTGTPPTVCSRDNKHLGMPSDPALIETAASIGMFIFLFLVIQTVSAE
jgi:hypothetical protein